MAGFRGIGPECTSRLRRGPGLTIVAGRNGSGKSSFAEALEVALTGDSSRQRLSARVSGRRTGPICIVARPGMIRVELAEDDVCITTVDVDRAAESAASPTRRTWVQRPGRQGLAAPVQVRGTLLGVYPDCALTEVAFELRGGEMLVLYTDGVTEARDVDGFYGAERLMKMVSSVGRPCAEAVAAALLTDVETFHQGRLRDDIAIMAIEATP